MRCRMRGADQYVDFVGGEQVAERTSLRIVLDLHGFEQRRRRRLAVAARVQSRALDPAYAGEVNAMVVREVTPDPHRRRHRVERDAHALAGDVLRRSDAGLAIVIDIAMAEDAGGE